MDEKTKACCKALFGRALRVELATWILSHEKETTFIQQEAQDAMRMVGESTSGTASELRNFFNWGMLERLSLGRNVVYRRAESALWSAFESIGQSMSAMQKGPTSSR